MRFRTTTQPLSTTVSANMENAWYSIVPGLLFALIYCCYKTKCYLICSLVIDCCDSCLGSLHVCQTLEGSGDCHRCRHCLNSCSQCCRCKCCEDAPPRGATGQASPMMRELMTMNNTASAPSALNHLAVLGDSTSDLYNTEQTPLAIPEIVIIPDGSRNQGDNNGSGGVDDNAPPAYPPPPPPYHQVITCPALLPPADLYQAPPSYDSVIAGNTSLDTRR